MRLPAAYMLKAFFLQLMQHEMELLGKDKLFVF
jgi:hypothetical protein